MGRATSITRGGAARASTSANLASPLEIQVGKRTSVRGTCLAIWRCGTRVRAGQVAWASQEAQRLQAQEGPQQEKAQGT